jgi:hypothetical protein
MAAAMIAVSIHLGFVPDKIVKPSKRLAAHQAAMLYVPASFPGFKTWITGHQKTATLSGSGLAFTKGVIC